ncbi:MAG: MFS transporter [Gemmatimonadota bacterium]
MPSPSFGALRYRNFRLFIFGQFVSLCGTWMQSIALSWLVLQLSNSAWKTGLVSALGAAPVLLFTLYGGVIADRVNKRRWLIVLQTLFLIEALALGVLTASHLITVPLIYGLAAFSGLISAFEIPIRQAYFVEMVGKADLMSAIALNSSAFNLSRIFGPMVAAWLMALFGPAACFFVNAASFLAVLVGLFLITARGVPAADLRKVGYREGIRHVLGLPLPRSLVIVTTVVTMFGASLIAILAVFARDVLKTQVGGYGGLMSGFGLGAASGALTLAAAGQRFPREKVALGSAVALGVSITLLGFVRHFPAAVLLLVVTGLAMALNSIMTNTILQTSAPDHIRGQVIGLYSFIVIGLAPFGSLQTAWIAEHFGASTAVSVGGLVCFVVASIIAWRMFRRPVPAVEAA